MTVSILLLHSFDLQLQFYCINSLLYNISILAGGGSGDTWLLMLQVIFSVISLFSFPFLTIFEQMEIRLQEGQP